MAARGRGPSIRACHAPLLRPLTRAYLARVHTQDWQQWSVEFPILERRTYLNSCSLGALSRRALARINTFHEDWHNYGASAWYEIWMGRLAELRTRVAHMIDAREG